MVDTAPDSPTTLWLCILIIISSCIVYYIYWTYIRDCMDQYRAQQSDEAVGGEGSSSSSSSSSYAQVPKSAGDLDVELTNVAVLEVESAATVGSSGAKFCCNIDMPRRSKGMLLCVFGVLILSPDAFFLRLSGSSLPGYTVLFSKYMISVLVFLALLLIQTKFDLKLSYEKLKGIGMWGLLAGIILGVSYVFFTLAIQMGIVANVLVIVASNPLVSAIIGYFAYNESMNLRTCITFSFCFGAILLVFISDLNSKSSATGNWLAIAAAVTLGMYFSLLRYIALTVGGEPDMVPCNMIAGLVVGIISLMIGGLPVMCSPLDGLYLLIQGVFTVSLSFAMITQGPSYISASEVSLYMFIETILGPIWVYLGGYEAPPKFTIYGGIILIVSLGTNSLLSLREESLPDKTSPPQDQNLDDSSDGNEGGMGVLHETFVGREGVIEDSNS